MTLSKNSLFILITFFTLNAHATLSDHFVTTWKTDNPGSSNDTSITIYTNSSYSYSYDVDWDNDGIFDEIGITGDVTHDFGSAGKNTIRITGDFPTIRASFDSEKIISIDQWGTNLWQSMYISFRGASNLINKAIDTPNLSNCTSLRFMFNEASIIGDKSENANWDWNTENITNMEYMFKDATSFNQNLSTWNVESVVDFSEMFENVKLSIFNYDALLIGWNNQELRSSVNFGGGESTYCLVEAQDAHKNMTSSYNWTILDRGVCESSLNILTKSIVFDENSIKTFAIEYSDPNYDTPSFAFTGGADVGLFTLDSITGEIAFTNAPDFETLLIQMLTMFT